MKKKYYFIIFGIVLIVFVLGLFFDLKFAEVIYNKNNVFAQTMAAIGETPAYGGLCFIGGGFIAGSLRLKNKLHKVALWLLAGFCAGVGIFLATRAMSSHNAFDASWATWYVMLPIAIIIDCSLGVLGFFLCKKSDNPELLKVLLFMLATVFFTLIGVTILKRIWARPRYRWLVGDVNNLDGTSGVNQINYFRNWWELSTGVKTEFIEKVRSDEFKSCPSGHTSSASMALLLMYLPLIDKRLKGKETTFLIIGALWAGLVAFTRHIMGAHFLTDTTFAYLLAMITLFVTNYFFFEFKKAKQ